jgi:hypothetical protein
VLHADSHHAGEGPPNPPSTGGTQPPAVLDRYTMSPVLVTHTFWVRDGLPDCAPSRAAKEGGALSVKQDA